MQYKIRYKRRFLWKEITVTGHRYEPSTDKMVLYFADGSIKELPQWSKCEVFLGTDWVLAVKKDMESKAGQSIPLTVGGA
jgi:hypothetical protein